MRWAVSAALAAGVLAGCGIGDSTTTKTTSSTRTPSTRTAPVLPATTATQTVTQPTPAPAPGSCSLADPGFHAGAPLDCVRKGVDVHLVHEHEILALPSVLARLLAVNSAPEITGRSRTFEPRGTFIRVTLAVTNATRRPRTIRPSQTVLVVGGRQFDEVVALEDSQDERSLLSRGGTGHPLRPGASVTGEVVFDVPGRLLPQVPKGAWIAIAGFGSSRAVDRRRLVGGIALGA